MMADVLNKRNKIHHLDPDTDEDMIPMFERDVDGTKRNNTHLLPRRNFCIIREYQPGHTPPSTPTPKASQEFGERFEDGRGRDTQYPPSSMKRTMSLSGAPGRLVRRLSGSRSKNPPLSLGQGPGGVRRSSSQGSATGWGKLQRSSSMGAAQDPNHPSFDPRSQFRRRPTNLSVKEARKAAAKGGADGNLDGIDPTAIDLEGGLDVSLCMEIDQTDPAGKTEPYRLLIPALWYQGPGDPNTAVFHKPTIMERLRGRRPSQSQNPDAAENTRKFDRSWSRSPDRDSLSPSLRGASMDVPRNSNNQRGELADLQATAAGMGRAPSQRRPSMAADGMRDPRVQPQAQNTYKQGYEGAPPPMGATNGTHNPPLQTNDLYRQGYEGAPPPIGDMARGPARASVESSRGPAPPLDNMSRGPLPAQQGPNKLQRNNSLPTSGYRRPSFAGGRLSSLFGRNKRKDGNNENYRDEYFNHHTPPANDNGEDVRPYAARGPSTDYYSDADSLPYSDEEEGGVYDDRPLPPAGQPKPAAAMPARRPSKAERFLGLEAGEGDNRRMSMQGGRSTLEEGQWEGKGYDEGDDYFGDVGTPKKKGWKGILGRS